MRMTMKADQTDADGDQETAGQNQRERQATQNRKGRSWHGSSSKPPISGWSGGVTEKTHTAELLQDRGGRGGWRSTKARDRNTKN